MLFATDFDIFHDNFGKKSLSIEKKKKSQNWDDNNRLRICIQDMKS